MEKNLKIEKLSDIVAWADGIIRDGGYYEEKYRSDATTAYCNVKAYELWRIRDVALESMERHSVYTDALNKDIADKAAKIDLLEKEIEGRKEGYTALKKRMDTDYISIDEHNAICKTCENKVAKLEKESEKWQDLAKMNRDTICNQYDVCEDFKKKIVELEKELADCKVKIRHQKENLDGINKTLEIRTKENESLIKVRNNQKREIEAHESENARLTEKIIELKRTIEKCKDYDTSLMDSLRINNDDLKEQVSRLKEELNESYKAWDTDSKNHQKREMTLVDEIAKKNRDIEYYKNQERIRTDQLSKEDDYGKSGFKRYIEHLIEEEERAVPERFKERLNEEITAIFTKEEETKVNDIPCGEDAIE